MTIGASNLVILALIAKYTKNKQAFVSLFIPLLMSLLYKFPDMLGYIQGTLSVPIYMLSRFPQILQNYKTQSTGKIGLRALRVGIQL